MHYHYHYYYPPQGYEQLHSLPVLQDGSTANGLPPPGKVATPVSQLIQRPATSHSQTYSRSLGNPAPTVERTAGHLLNEAEADRAFIVECLTPLNQDTSRGGIRHRIASKVLELLTNTAPASLDGTQRYVLDENACTNLSPSAPSAPILSHHVHKHLLRSPGRPVEQILRRFPMSMETSPCALGTVWRKENITKFTTIGKIRDRFLQSDHHIAKTGAWNLIQLSNPTQLDFMPEYLKGPEVGLLDDIKRLCLDNAMGNTKRDAEALRENVAHWRDSYNLIMLAEAGATTLPHYDTFGYGTWITCLEGEIGFAWLRDDPTLQKLRQWVALEDGDSSAELGYCFKVLRPGDSIYLPPGTVHYVFRKPDGGQTLAACGSVLHYADVQRWLFVLMTQISDEESKEQVETMAPYLMAALRKLLDQTKTMDDLIKYGVMSVDDRNRVLEMICQIEADAKRQ